MGARRRAGPAAIAAALLGVCLTLYRPAAVPELRAGSRAAGRPEPAALRAPLEDLSPVDVGPTAARAGRPGGAEEAPDAEALAVWRDALADRPYMPGPAHASYHSEASAGPPAPAALREPPPPPARRSVPAARGRASAPRARAAPAAAPRALSRTSPSVGAPAPRRREPLALGPAPAAEGEGEEEAEPRSAVDVRPGGARSVPGSRMARRARAFPLFRPPSRPAARTPRAAARRRARPLLLSRLLGPGPLRPPASAIVPPDLSGLRTRGPLRLPDGSPVPSLPYELRRIEATAPVGAACRRRARHWDPGLLWHDGQARGAMAGARWLWQWKESVRWWALRVPEETPLLRHRGLWWSKQRGVWFALHDGELWSWRRFADWDAEGLIRLADGVELIYSSDFTKVAVLTPGSGAVLYDAHTGAELGEWCEDELPRRRPRAPAGLRLPRGI